MKYPQLPIYKAVYRGPITPFITGKGPPCRSLTHEVIRSVQNAHGFSGTSRVSIRDKTRPCTETVKALEDLSKIIICFTQTPGIAILFPKNQNCWLTIMYPTWQIRTTPLPVFQHTSIIFILHRLLMASWHFNNPNSRFSKPGWMLQTRSPATQMMSTSTSTPRPLTWHSYLTNHDC